jgi:hypothetical protein
MVDERFYKVLLVSLISFLLVVVTLLITIAYPFWESKAPLKEEFSLTEIEDMEFSNSIERSAVLGAHWFGRAQRTDGSFVYIYDPDNATEVTDYSYSIARHCGSVYTLVWAFETTGDERYLEAAEDALSYIQGDIRTDGEIRYIMNGGRSRLFDNALALIGYCYLYNATHDDDHLEQLRGFANLCLYLMDDEGRFDYILDPLLPDKFEEEVMASGEALLGLALSYKFTGERKYLDGFIKSADHHMEYLSANKLARMSTAYFSWMSSSFSEGYILTGDERYLNFSYDMADWMIRNHFGSYFKVGGVHNAEMMADESHLVGSFRTYPSMNSCTYSEGLGDVLHAAILAGDDERIERYTAVLLNASNFIRNLMYDEEESYDLANPHLVLGGYRHDLFDRVNRDSGWQSRWIRIDYTQHAIGALFRMLRYIPHEIISDH